MSIRKRRLFLVCAAAILLIAAVVVFNLLILPALVPPVGTGIPQITSQFSRIRTLTKTPTLRAQAGNQPGNIQLVRFDGGDGPRVRTQSIFVPCAMARDVTATPTGQPMLDPTLTPTSAPTALPGAAVGAPDYVVLRVVSDESEACYQVGEVFLSEGNRFEVAVGVTSAISGEIAIDRANLANSQIGEFVIDISQLRSNSSSRDGAIRQRWLESNRFPLARLISAAPVGLPARAYQEGEVLSFQILSVLEIRQVQASVTFQAVATFSGGELRATAYADLRMTDFGIEPPSLFGLRVNDAMRIVLNIVAREPEAAVAETDAPNPVPTATVASTERACQPTTLRAAGPLASPEPPIRAFVDKGYILSGTIRSSGDCAPVANARVMFWLANPEGQYDAAHTGTVLTDADGAYQFESNFPGSYDNARPHIHLYVAAEGYRAIATEHFPRAGHSTARFDIVLVPES